MLPFEIKSDTSKGHPLWPGEEDTLKFTQSPERLCNVLINPRLPYVHVFKSCDKSRNDQKCILS